MNRLLYDKIANQDEIVQSLLQRLPGYTPGWMPIPGSKAHALLEILARYRTLLDSGASKLAERNLLAFLDTLAISMLPAHAARAPVVFQLTPGAAVDVTIAADSQLAAQPLPAPASPLADKPASNPAPVIFFTEQTVTLARAKLTALYSIDPQSDTYADHTKNITNKFTVFGDMQQTEHAIYLGHDRLFKLGGREITILLQFTLSQLQPRTSKTISKKTTLCKDVDMACDEDDEATALNQRTELGDISVKPIKIKWQYLSESGWITLQRVEEEDTTRGLTRSGQIALRLNCGPDAKKATYHGRSSYWLRGTLETPLIRGELLRNNLLKINDLDIRVQFSKKNLLPEAAFAETVQLDVSKDFYPFGQQPARFSTFYLASTEVFQRRGARVHLDIKLSCTGTPVPVNSGFTLSWEYYGRNGWDKLGIESSQPYQFADTSRSISFNCPSDWQETLVNGAKNYWLRVRITNGSFITVTSVPVGSSGNATMPVITSATAPIVEKLTLSFTYITNPEKLEHCLSFNDFRFEDHTEDALWSHRNFDPFYPVSDLQPSLHFDFNQPLPAGLVSMYVHVPGAEEQEPDTSSVFTWEYLSQGDSWTQLSVRDETNGLLQSGMVQFIGPPDALPSSGLEGIEFPRYRIRARFKEGMRKVERKIQGVWLNSIWASHRVRIEQEFLGIADGTPSQALRFVRAPVLANQTDEMRVEVREWSGNGEGWQIIIRQVAEEKLRYDRHPVTQQVTAVWVRWDEQTHLYDAKPRDRVFMVEHATGLLRFGDGLQGMIPTAGSRIVVSYSSGGGKAGNVARGAITQLRSAAPLVASITNPMAAQGGAAGESAAAIVQRGPQKLRHLNRAITAQDIEWLAREASPEVARARCLSITGPDGFAQRGWITVIILPDSDDDQPMPSAQLQQTVANYLRDRIPAAVVRRIRIVEPQYIKVRVVAQIVPLAFDQAAIVEATVRQQLNRFLHPLSGGFENTGWTFGEDLHLSHLAHLIENTTGIDFAQDIRMTVDGAEQGSLIAVPRDALLSSGQHELKLQIKE